MPLRSFTEAETVLLARRRLERPLLAAVWLGVAMFCLWRGNWFYLSAATLAVGVNLYAVRRGKEVYVHRVFVNIAVLAATAVMMVEIATRADEVRLLVKLGDYLILIQLCKLFERKRNRDYVQMLVLSPLLVIAATLYCSAVWFAVLLMVYIALMCYTAMVFTLKRNLDAAAAAQLATEAAPISPHRVAWNAIREWPGRTLAARTAVAVAAMTLIGVVMFLAAPRTHAGGTEAADGISAFAGAVRLGETRRLYLSDRVVMTARVVSQPSGAAGPIYLRGRAFDTYADSNWTSTTENGAREVPPPPADLLAQAQAIKISMVPSLLPVVFVPPGTVHLDTSDGRWQLTAKGEVVFVRSRISGRTVDYTVYSFVEPRTARQRQYLARIQWRGLLRELAGAQTRSRVPPRVRELAEQWCEDLLPARRMLPPLLREGQDLAIARRIANRLRERCAYSLDLSGADPSRDGVEDFLFYTKRGHCEYFASALTVMCQSLGVRARLATGFVVDRPAATGTTVYVRDRDAHAWTEVYAPGKGWVVVDASPARSGTRSGGLFGWAGRLWEKVGFLWDRYVLGYDAAARRRVGRWFGDMGKSLLSAARSAAAALGRSVKAFLVYARVDRLLGRAALVTGAVALLLEVVLVLRLIGARIRRRRRRGRAAPADLQFIQRLFDALIRHGLTVHEHQTPRELADRAAETLDLPAPALRNLVDLYYRLRWGEGAAGPAEIHAARRRVVELERVLARRRRRAARLRLEMRRA